MSDIREFLNKPKRKRTRKPSSARRRRKPVPVERQSNSYKKCITKCKSNASVDRRRGTASAAQLRARELFAKRNVLVGQLMRERGYSRKQAWAEVKNT